MKIQEFVKKVKQFSDLGKEINKAINEFENNPGEIPDGIFEKLMDLYPGINVEKLEYWANDLNVLIK